MIKPKHKTRRGRRTKLVSCVRIVAVDRSAGVVTFAPGRDRRVVLKWRLESKLMGITLANPADAVHFETVAHAR